MAKKSEINTSDHAPLVCLMVDNSSNEMNLVSEMMKSSSVINQFFAVQHGCDALMFLNKSGEYANAPTPHLILMDIDLEELMDGLELAEQIKLMPQYQNIPIALLSGYDHQAFVERALDIGISIYVTKPFTREKFLRVIDRVENFWLQAVVS